MEDSIVVKSEYTGAWQLVRDNNMKGHRVLWLGLQILEPIYLGLILGFFM